MNVIELLLTALLVAGAVMAVARFFVRELRAEEPTCGSCETCPGHTRQGCSAVRRGAGQ